MMNEKEIIREIMSLRKISQPQLAKKVGFKNQSNISGLLNNNTNGIRMDNFYKLIKAMNCEVVVRDLEHPTREWVVDMAKKKSDDKQSGGRIKLTPIERNIDLDDLLKR